MAATTTRQESLRLALSPELRNRIPKLVLVSPKPAIHDDDSGPTNDLEESSADPLFRINHQLGIESLTIYYSQNDFVFCSPHKTSRWLRSLPDKAVYHFWMFCYAAGRPMTVPGDVYDRMTATRIYRVMFGTLVEWASDAKDVWRHAIVEERSLETACLGLDASEEVDLAASIGKIVELFLHHISGWSTPTAAPNVSVTIDPVYGEGAWIARTTLCNAFRSLQRYAQHHPQCTVQGHMMLLVDNFVSADLDPIEMVVAVDLRRKPRATVRAAMLAMNEIGMYGGTAASGATTALLNLVGSDYDLGEGYLRELAESPSTK
ncbi:hypothetical protein LTR86_001714 [Recurvomyces mirabilis]|nr:hypothetical protein LTR86_001714 [Recurvomyces mirabilis]